MIYSATPENLNLCVETLLSGKLLAIPTETVYGLAADARNDAAVKRIYELKGRPSNNPLIVHCYNKEQILSLLPANTSSNIISRIEKLSILWPGPISAIVPKPSDISSLVSAGGPTIAVRIPDHPIALQILEKAKIPVAAPSANKSLKVSPTSAQHVEDSFASDDLVIIDGGDCKIGIESTVVDLTAAQVKILRPGAIDAEIIEKVLGEPCGLESLVNGSNLPLASPGLLGKHYAPETRLLRLSEFNINNHNSPKIGLILFSNEPLLQLQNFSGIVDTLSSDGNTIEVGRKLYSCLRKMDSMKLDCIYIDKCEARGIGFAIMDRINRALSPSGSI